MLDTKLTIRLADRAGTLMPDNQQLFFYKVSMHYAR
jgi:hypothetical protein